MTAAPTRTVNPPSAGTAYAACDDAALVVASLVGDLAAYDELARRHRAALVATARQTGLSRAVAEEVAQDALFDAFRALPSLEDSERFGVWLRAIARFRALRVRQREARTEPTDAPALESLIEKRRPAHDAPAHDALWEAFARLVPEHREALYLHYCEGLPLAAIAAHLFVPETTIKGRLFRARDALRRLLSAADAPIDPATKG